MRPIVLCLILDSRQNVRLTSVANQYIVLCLILDSRQNSWMIEVSEFSDCTVPYFGFKAKLQPNLLSPA